MLSTQVFLEILAVDFSGFEENKNLNGSAAIVDIRVVAATNRDLKAMVAEGRFRSDLYYRLHVFPIEAPPLRDRRSDIPLLIRYFTQKYAQRMNRHIKSIPNAAIETLTGYDWPGNIRELQNLIERSVILTQGSLLQVAMPESQTSTESVLARGPALSPSHDREKILLALKEAKGVVGGKMELPHGWA